jgi:hypothetical protein
VLYPQSTSTSCQASAPGVAATCRTAQHRRDEGRQVSRGQKRPAASDRQASQLRQSITARDGVCLPPSGLPPQLSRDVLVSSPSVPYPSTVHPP